MVSASHKGIPSHPPTGKKRIKNFWYDNDKKELVIVIEKED